MIKVVIFDLDDTLISEREYINSGYEQIANYLSQKYSISKEDSRKKLKELFEQNPKNVFNRFMDKYSILYDEKLIQELVDKYRRHIPNIHYYRDVEVTLKELKSRGIKLGIITDGYASTQKRKLEALRANNIFDKIIVTDELGKEYWKPNPKVFEIMKEYFDILYEEMIYVADNPRKDFYIGSIYPIKTVRIYRKDSIYRNETYLKGITERVKIKNLMELLNKNILEGET